MSRDHVIFYPIIKRRTDYSIKSNGEYYHYHHYRQEIREDCLMRCVYCDVQEAECGGDEIMELEHFRPQKHFARLSNDPNNLVYSCSGCNNLKSDYWPALDGGSDLTITEEGEGFLEPFIEDRNDYFHVMENGELVETKPPAKYMIILLALNRGTRRRIREIRIQKIKLIEMVDTEIEEFESFCATNLFPDEQRKNLEKHSASLIAIRDNLVKCLFLEP
jgi:hypothetical protein